MVEMSILYIPETAVHKPIKIYVLHTFVTFELLSITTLNLADILT